MTKKNKSYWQQRAEAKVLDVEKMGLTYESQMKECFLQASSNIQTDITKLYVRYAKDNKLSYAETLKYLRDDERAEFKHDLDYYIKNASNADYRFEHRQELQALSVRARVKRMEAMKARIILESEKLFNSLEQGTMALYHRAYDEAYHRTAFDVFQKVGMGMAFDKPSPNTIKTLLEYPWSGKSYSQSLWDMEKGFVDNLNRTLTAGLIQGKSVQELSRQFSDEAIGKDFYKGKPKGTLKRAQRLVRTETAFILNQATSDMYDELGVDEYEFLGTLDSKTCEHCGGLDGKHYVSDEKKIGINYPPMHPWCRCTTIPYFPEDEDEDIGQRIARGADGKNYYV
ncbi:MAG: minor capsid protein, partial [Clostridiales bacterium]